MRAILTNFGTVGEVYPILALAQEISRNGHSAIVALSPEYEPWTRQLGLDFVQVGPPARKIQERLTLAAVRNELFLESQDVVQELLVPLCNALPLAYKDLKNACGGGDILIGGHLQPAAKMVHETTGISYVSLCATYFEPEGNTTAYQQATQWMVNRCREELGLAPLRDPLAIDGFSDKLVLHALSSHVVPRHRGWPSYHHLAGFFRLREEWWQPDEALCRFLAEGEPPVVVSFGSMVHDDPDHLAALVIEAARLAKCRMVIQSGWSGLSLRSQDLPEQIFPADYIPHDWLFSRAACIVHHGGAGTSAAAFRAGVPAVVIPYILDQAFWCRRAEELGVTGPPLPPFRLTAEELARRITETLNHPGLNQTARLLSDKIRDETGTRTARVLIEEMLAEA